MAPDTLLAVGLAGLAICVGILLIAVSNSGTGEGFGMCAPSRRANITASTAQPARRIVTQLGPPPGWHEPAPVAIVRAVAVPEWDHDVDDWDDDWDDEPETELPLAVPGWPVPAVVEVEVEPVPVVVDWIAARFSSLEVRR